MGINGYQFCNLSQSDLDKIKNLEKKLTKDNQDDSIVLLALTNKE